MADVIYTLAYPRLAPADRAWIEAFRQQHDLPFRDVVAAHFTLVFGTPVLGRAAYVAHVAQVAAACEPIEFVCRYAMQGVDDSNAQGYVFLVPDEGYSGVSQLHDRLYCGGLAGALRLDIPFIPHITIGTLPTHREARDLCDHLNDKGFCLRGRIDAVSVSVLEQGVIQDIAQFAL